jgi:Do/DeqQ family serine protease
MIERFRKYKISLKTLLAVALVFMGTHLLLNRLPFFDMDLPNIARTADSEFSDRQDFKNILELQSAFVDNAKKIKPTVVSINKIYEKIQPSSLPDSHPSPSVPWYFSLKKWMSSSLETKRYRMENVGSGVILNSRGYILTNYHVVKDIADLLVRLPQGSDHQARVVGSDPLTDLAVLKISTFRNLPYPAFGRSSDIGVGEWVMAIGNPYGLEGTVTVGVISGTGRSNLGITTYENFIQTDASINPGNSGGPLINLKGQVIGINTAVAQIGSGVGFAIPIEMAMDIASQLINEGEVARGWLGIGIQSLTPDLAVSFNLKHIKSGVLVNSVDKKTPAESGGLIRGDIIVQYNGVQVSGSSKLQQMVADSQIGKTVLIKVIRNGAEKTLQVKIGRLAS